MDGSKGPGNGPGEGRPDSGVNPDAVAPEKGAATKKTEKTVEKGERTGRRRGRPVGVAAVRQALFGEKDTDGESTKAEREKRTEERKDDGHDKAANVTESPTDTTDQRPDTDRSLTESLDADTTTIGDGAEQPPVDRTDTPPDVAVTGAKKPDADAKTGRTEDTKKPVVDDAVDKQEPDVRVIADEPAIKIVETTAESVDEPRVVEVEIKEPGESDDQETIIAEPIVEATPETPGDSSDTTPDTEAASTEPDMAQTEVLIPEVVEADELAKRRNARKSATEGATDGGSSDQHTADERVIEVRERPASTPGTRERTPPPPRTPNGSDQSGSDTGSGPDQAPTTTSHQEQEPTTVTAEVSPDDVAAFRDTLDQAEQAVFDAMHEKFQQLEVQNWMDEQATARNEDAGKGDSEPVVTPTAKSGEAAEPVDTGTPTGTAEPITPPPVREVFRSVHEKDIIEEFLETLPNRDYDALKQKPPEERDRIIQEWIDAGKPNKMLLAAEEAQLDNDLLGSDFAMNNGIDFNTWNKQLTPEQKEKYRREYVQTPEYQFMEFARNNRHPEAGPASLITYQAELEKVTDPVTGKVSYVTRIYDTADVKRGLHKELSAAEKKQARKDARAQLTWHIRTKRRFAAWQYILLDNVFDIERAIAEDNKKRQEAWRAIVDTGPDDNERWLFSEEMDDGSFRLVETGEVVNRDVALHYFKNAIKDPHKFQAACHYEISKQPEHKQIEMWESIMNKMALAGYDKYAMYGVLVGLQFMNKPQYLAFKNTKLDYVPIYETQIDAEGRERAVIDPLTNEPVVRRHTADTLYRSRYGVLRKRVRDPSSGRKVQIGDVMKDEYKLAFDTVELKLTKLDQEYNEVMPDGVTPMYATRYERAWRDVEDDQGHKKLNPDGTIQRELAIVGEYKSKRVLNVKTKAFAHEIAGKFNSYQYGFRGADVAIALDFTRRAIYRCADIAKQYDVSRPANMPKDTFTEWQELQLALNRLFMAVSASRMSGSAPGEGGKAPEADAYMEHMRGELIRADQQSRQPRVRNGRQVYPPRISGTAEAIMLWESLARYIDMATIMFPNLSVIRQSDYQAIQDPFKTRNQGTKKEQRKAA